MLKFSIESWEDYEKMKILRGLDKDYFCCSEKWEVDYLKNKILNEYPEMDERIILFAIYFTNSNTSSSKKREYFIEDVCNLLSIPEIPSF